MTDVFHFTDIENVPRIIETGGLLSRTRIQSDKVSFEDIAYEDIQGSRATFNVPCGPKGILHDYVPFYFAPLSPMLSAIHNGRVPQYTRGQKSIVYLVSSAEAIARNRNFVFTDGHGIMRFTAYFNDLSDLNKIDWDIMVAKYWANTLEDGDRKRRRQAEFLVHRDFPWELIDSIGVLNSEIKKCVLEKIKSCAHQPQVKVMEDWYF
ncbi:MAG: DUF4433 domain-containing protein [Candidatus Obscuribacter sp.]|nr:DUF4433 domain-containing protein [Candidatus Obscuribacter sp.]